MGSDSSTSPAAGNSSEAQSAFRRCLAPWLRPKVAISLFLVGLVLLAPTLMRGYKMSRVPSASEPFDTQAIRDFVVPGVQNAYFDYREAVALYDESELNALPVAEDEINVWEVEWADVPEALRQWVRSNHSVIELLKRGAEKPHSQRVQADHFPLCRAEDDRMMLQWLVLLEALRLRAEERPDQAWELLRSRLRASRHLMGRGLFSDCLSGIWNHDHWGIVFGEGTSYGIVRWAQDPAVTKELLLRAQRELAEEIRRGPSISQTYQAEYLLLRDEIRSPTLPHRLYEWSPIFPMFKLGPVGVYALGEPEIGERGLSHVFRNLLSQLDKPRRERTKQSGRNACFELEPTAPASAMTPGQIDDCIDQSPLCRQLMPMMERAVFAVDEAEVRNSLVKTVLALEIYRRQHGEYPEALTQLVPDFMSEVPDDIFEASPTPLKYRRDGDRALIWSVSQNGVDDAGNVETGKDMGYLLGPKQPKPSTGSSGDPAQRPE